MARSKRRKLPTARVLAALLAAAVLVFALGEVVVLTRSDSGRIQLARRFGLADQADLTRLVGRQLHRALTEAGVPADSVHESVVDDAEAGVHWRIGLPPGASTLQVNYAITHVVEEVGAEVLRGTESWRDDHAQIVTLLVGLPHRPTHQLTIVRPTRTEENAEDAPSRLALVLYGFRDDEAAADSFFALPAPFAVAIVPGAKASGALFKAAHRSAREVVLHLPLEPVNYPQVNPGPGTILVTMKPARIASDVRHWVEQSEPVVAAANHMGSLATQDMTVMTAVYRELRNHHLAFMHVMPAPGAVCKSLASEMGVVYDEPDLVLDLEPRADDTAALEKRWKGVLKDLPTRGHMVVWVRATPTSYRWLARTFDPRHLKNVDLVPMSALIRRPAPD